MRSSRSTGPSVTGMISANTDAKRSYLRCSDVSFSRSAVGLGALGVAEQAERAIAEVHLVEDDAAKTREVGADDDVGVLPAQRERVVPRARRAMPLDDARALETAEVREDVALGATELLAQLVHRERSIGEVERRDDLPAEARDAREARRDLASDAVEDGGARGRHGIDGGRLRRTALDATLAIPLVAELIARADGRWNRTAPAL